MVSRGSIKLEDIRGIKPSLGHFCSLICFLQFLLRFSKFCQVESSNFLSLLNLLLVGLDLRLELVGQVGHAVLVLLVLLYLENQFLAASLGLVVSLGGLRASCLALTKLLFKLSDAGFKLGHCSSSSSDGSVICL